MTLQTLINNSDTLTEHKMLIVSAIVNLDEPFTCGSMLYSKDICLKSLGPLRI